MHSIPIPIEFDCQGCEDKQVAPLFYIQIGEVTADVREEAASWAKWHHWCDSHHVCAVCGGHLASGKLVCLINDGRIPIHPDYTADEKFTKVERGDVGRLLDTHEKCAKKYTE